MNNEFQGVSLPDDDEISVQEMEDLIKQVELFYAERDNPKMNLVWLANLILKRLMLDRDILINCEGEKGTGKSNLILLLSLIQARYSGIYRNKKTGKLVNVLPRIKPMTDEWEHIKIGFQFKKNMSFLDESETVKNKFHALDRYMPLIIDEGSKNLHKYEWNSKLQFMLVRTSDTERYQNKAMYVCFPNFKELNSAFRNDRIQIRLYLYDRNKNKGFSSCIVSLKDHNRYVVDAWHTDDNARTFEYLLRKKPASLRTPQDILYAEKRLAGFAGAFDVPSLEKIAPRIWDIYMKYKIYYAQKDADTTNTEEEDTSVRVMKWKVNSRKIIELLKLIKPDLSDKIIFETLGITKGSYQILLRDTQKELEKIKNAKFTEQAPVSVTDQ